MKKYDNIWSHKEIYTILINENFDIDEKIKLNEMKLKNFLFQTNYKNEVLDDNINDDYVKSSIEIMKKIGGLIPNSIQIKNNLFMTFFQDNEDDENNYGFCVWKSEWISLLVCKIKIEFFNSNTNQKNKFLVTTKNLINKFSDPVNLILTKKNFSNPLYKNVSFGFLFKPILPKLIKSFPNNIDSFENYKLIEYKNSPHYTSYLKHRTWNWSLSNYENIVSQIISIIFKIRIYEGFSLISLNPISFLKNIKFEGDKKLQLFYNFHYLKKNNEIMTEVYFVSSSGKIRLNQVEMNEVEYYKFEFNNIYNNDLKIFTIYFTFENLYRNSKNKRTIEKDVNEESKSYCEKVQFDLNNLCNDENKKELFLEFNFQKDNEVIEELDNEIKLFKERIMFFLKNLNDYKIDTETNCFSKIIDDENKNLIITKIIEKDSRFEISLYEVSQNKLFDSILNNINIEKLNKKSRSNENFNEINFEIKKYINFIFCIYNFYYSKNIYNLLLKIDEKSLNKNLIEDSVKNLYEYSCEIDLTELFENIITNKNIANIKKNFNAILLKYFKKINQLKYHFMLKNNIENLEDLKSNFDSKNNSLKNKLLKYFDDNNSTNSSSNEFLSTNTNFYENTDFISDLPIFFRMECSKIELISSNSSKFIDENYEKDTVYNVNEYSYESGSERERRKSNVSSSFSTVDYEDYGDYEEEFVENTKIDKKKKKIKSIKVIEITNINQLFQKKNDILINNYDFENIDDDDSLLSTISNSTKSILKLIFITFSPGISLY
jgi:hypothetical protein